MKALFGVFALILSTQASAEILTSACSPKALETIDQALKDPEVLLDETEQGQAGQVLDLLSEATNCRTYLDTAVKNDPKAKTFQEVYHIGKDGVYFQVTLITDLEGNFEKVARVSISPRAN